MKKLGVIGGMGPAATALFYEMIIEKKRKRILFFSIFLIYRILMLLARLWIMVYSIMISLPGVNCEKLRFKIS